MQLRLLLAFLLFSCSFTSFAQTTTSIDENTIVLEETNESWILSENESDKKILIDFESINSTINDIRIKSLNNEIQFSDVVSDLPQDAIYELDLSILTTGDYIIEIRTYTEVLTKEIKI